ncbi:hypothetical protein LAM01_08800 [Amylolactobacillus amylophilus]|nr:hypothetical protein LAM01_08800 [Amylolactobacillus amylophilus]
MNIVVIEVAGVNQRPLLRRQLTSRLVKLRTSQLSLLTQMAQQQMLNLLQMVVTQ